MICGKGLGMDVLIYFSDACGLFDRVARPSSFSIHEKEETQSGLHHRWRLSQRLYCNCNSHHMHNPAIDTIVVGVLHDVIDDTCENLSSVEEEFGCDVAKLVSGVSRLSYINQVRLRATTCFRPTTTIIIEGMLVVTLARHRLKPRVYIGCMKSGPVLAQKNVKYLEPEYWKFGEEDNRYFLHEIGQI